MNGILLIDKATGITSRGVVDEVCRKLNIKKVGHTGTLDPLATGVLVICVGEATKVVDLLTSLDKEYIAEVILGTSTDTLDITGNIINQIDVNISKKDIDEVLNSFKGKYIQEVPIYSAVKVNGKKLYEYAREKINIELPKREVEIKNISLLDYYKRDNNTYFKFKCLVSKGTYIRSLIKDICDKLNTVGCMSNLRRIKQGKFTIDNCIKIEDISEDKLISIQNILDIPKYEVDDNLKKKISNGCILENTYDSNLIMYTYKDKLLAIYQEKKEDKSKIKPYKMFGGIK